jgi:hypothetical protein
MAGRMLSIIVAVVLALSSVPSAQVDRRMTIPDMIRGRAPDPLKLGRILEVMPETLEEMLPTADLVVEGTVEPINTYLSSDQKDLYTDYLVTPLRTVLQRNVVPTTGPGKVPPIIVKRWGGRTVIDGVQVIVEDNDVRSFRPGERLLLILVYNKGDGKYHLPADDSGAFSVNGDQIEPMVNHPRVARFRGMAIAQFELEVRRLAP